MQQWSKAIAKCRSTAIRWRNIGAGFLFNVLAANVYMIPLFSYVGQLAEVSQDVQRTIQHMKASLFPGPGNWLPDLLLHNMRLLGFEAQVHDVQISAASAKVRVAYRSTLDIDTLSTETGLAINAFFSNATPDHPHHIWHTHSYVVNAALARRQFRASNGHVSPPIAKLLRALPSATPQLQKTIGHFLKPRAGATLRSITHLLRTRIRRWHFEDLGIPIGHATERIMRRLQLLGKSSHCTPACKAIYLKTVLNGWTTTRRMRSIAGNLQKAPCLLCKTGEDSLEHLPHCPVVRNLFDRNGCSCQHMADFIGIDKLSFPTAFQRKAKLIHSIHHTFNTLRHNPG